MAAALGRPEGTLKAQVHRGLATLREAFLASQRQDHEELTA
jgi:DNA-directed RNA polymerase specialized sigma24 family protein